MIYVGLDLGQRQDHSAIAVVERMDRWVAYQGPAFHSLEVRHLERMALGTAYPAVVYRVQEVLQTSMRRGGCALVVDATGVGAPVVDLLKAAKLGCELTPVSITGGERESQSGTGAAAVWCVPKKDLVAGVQVLLERRELKIAAQLRDAGTLVKELMSMRTAQRGTAGRVRMGAEGFGEHDDLAMALALACWRARRKRSGEGGRNGVGAYDPVLRWHCRLNDPPEVFPSFPERR